MGWLTGLYLVLSGSGRFLVEFVRINPKLYWGMSNAQCRGAGIGGGGWGGDGIGAEEGAGTGARGCGGFGLEPLQILLRGF